MDKKDSADENEASNGTDCSICMEPFVQPVILPCKHTFCYLCVKGLVTQQNNNCALCREMIPRGYLDNPQLLDGQSSTKESNDSYRWFYRGQSGWWQYDDRTSAEIEAAYQNNEQQCEVLLAGSEYIIDLQTNRQTRKSNPGYRRRIKRDLITSSKKGVAGIYQDQTSNSDATNSKPSCSSNDSSNATVPQQLVQATTVHSASTSAAGVPTRTDNEVLTTPSICITSCCSGDPNNLLNMVKSILALKPNSAAVRTEPEPDTGVLLPRSFNCTASCSTDNTNDVISPEKRVTEDADEVSSCTKRRKTNSVKILKNKENILQENDLCKNFGIMAAQKLYEMNPVQRLYAEKIINDALFQGLTEKLTDNSQLLL